MDEKKRLIENIVSLFVLQGFNYILPLISMPYLVRILGPEYYGKVAFAQSMILFLNVIVDFGFNFSATKQISVNRDNNQRVSEIYTSVLIWKTIIMSAVFVLMMLFVNIIPRFKEDIILYLITFGMVIGNVMFPIFLFQGLEKMKYITKINIVAKTIFTVMIFVIIQEQSDYIFVPLLNTISSVGVSVFTLIFISRKLGVKMQRVKWVEMKFQLVESWPIFLSNVSSNLYMSANTFFLGIFTNDMIVGYFSAAEKIINAVKGIMTPIGQAIYPYIAKKAMIHRNVAINFIKKILIIVVSLFLSVSALLLLAAPQIGELVLGNAYGDSIMILKIMSFLPLLSAINNVLGIQTLLVFGYKKQFSSIVVTAGLLSLIMIFILIPILGGSGTAISVMLTEVYITIRLSLFIKKHRIYKINKDNLSA